MIFDSLAYYNMIREHNINIIYSGPIWADAIEGIAGTIKKRLEFDELPLNAAQSVYSVFIEQMNNILMYSEEKEKYSMNDGKMMEVSKGIFVLGANEKSYFIQSGNVIKNDRVEFIKEQIDYLNTLDKPELRQYYKARMKSENTNPESKGAGIGLIEIARRATSKVEYSFAPYDEGLTFFSLFVIVEQGGK
ncbi:MAG: SiaB family protein kinase [Oscillospiraceae bacterium]|jgi:hypothetical protein|nr:SiaB family protein kinase [Oscillospiraceae bacterium]